MKLSRRSKNRGTYQIYYPNITYEQVKKFNIKNKIRTRNEYQKKCPENFPLYPQQFKGFKKQWKGWNNFLYPKYDDRYVSFKEAKKIVRKLKIKSRKEYAKKYKKVNWLFVNGFIST